MSSRATKPTTADAGPSDDPKPAPAPKPAEHAPVGVSGFALDPPPPPPPPEPKPQLILGVGPSLWEGHIPSDRSARRLVFWASDHAMEAAVAYLRNLGSTGTERKVSVRRLDVPPPGWVDPPTPIPPPSVAPEFSPNAAPPPAWANR